MRSEKIAFHQVRGIKELILQPFEKLLLKINGELVRKTKA
jgi:hypothetical protein